MLRTSTQTPERNSVSRKADYVHLRMDEMIAELRKEEIAKPLPTYVLRSAITAASGAMAFFQYEGSSVITHYLAQSLHWLAIEAMKDAGLDHEQRKELIHVVDTVMARHIQEADKAGKSQPLTTLSSVE